MATLKELCPSGLDSELRSLGPDGGGSEALLGRFLRLLQAVTATRTDFELTQAYLGLFMKVSTDLHDISLGGFVQWSVAFSNFVHKYAYS